MERRFGGGGRKPAHGGDNGKARSRCPLAPTSSKPRSVSIPHKKWMCLSWRIEKFGLGMIFVSAHGYPPRKGYEDRQLNYQPP